MDWMNNDTSPEAEAVLIELYRRMTPAEKARRIAQGMQALEEMQRARIRAEYGVRPESEVFLRLAALRLPREMMVEIWGWDPEVEGD